ncbi:MAG TPA: helix-turn-helix domain-containing protein, partial [Alphaproteobacteria bacterium]|nr:helix-turn-helix domain-containing protein [Alphaproteobacteria bacterium]
LTFQQIQKYERGTNRVSASMLYKAAEAMEVPVSFFFDGYGDLPLEPVPASAVTLGEGSLARSVAALPPDVRDGFKQLVEGLVSKRVS